MANGHHSGSDSSHKQFTERSLPSCFSRGDAQSEPGCIQMTKYESHEKRFVVDAMLGKLAKWLRILGFDTRYERLDRPQQLEHYRKEGFYIITRKQRWMHQDHVYFLSSNDSMDQLKEVIAQIPIAF
ncbi:MAG: hypothetical protein GX433_10655, partial [Deltaproteobacteria bacterium]|nr:hypothetical protein [Deltaproteobacteria bacterium]